MEHALREEGRSRPSRTGPAAPVPPLIVGPLRPRERAADVTRPSRRT